jgi:UDP-glucuronate decarboxylase
MQHPKILITGASGFLGQYILNELKNSQFQVYACSRKDPPNFSHTNWYKADLLNVNDINYLLNSIKPTHIIHCAWEVTHGTFWTSDHNLDWVSSSLHLLKKFKENGGERFLGVGTCVEYDFNSEACIEGKTPLNPVSLYGISKKSFYDIASSFCALNNISFTWARIFQVVGAGEPVTRLLPSIMSSMMQNKIANVSNAEAIRDFIDIRDVAEAIVKQIECNIEGPVNIARGIPITIGEVCEKAASLIGTPDLINVNSPIKHSNDIQILYANNDLLENVIKFTPKHDVNDMIESIYEWLIKLNPS